MSEDAPCPVCGKPVTLAMVDEAVTINGPVARVDTFMSFQHKDGSECSKPMDTDWTRFSLEDCPFPIRDLP